MRTISVMVRINVDDTFDPLPQRIDRAIANIVRRTIVSSIENEGEMTAIYPNKEFYYGRVTAVPVED